MVHKEKQNVKKRSKIKKEHSITKDLTKGSLAWPKHRLWGREENARQAHKLLRNLERILRVLRNHGYIYAPFHHFSFKPKSSLDYSEYLKFTLGFRQEKIFQWCKLILLKSVAVHMAIACWLLDISLAVDSSDH